jgi:squalene cyclase
VSDKKLARIQFAAALIEALETGVLKDRLAVSQAARLVATDQKPNGSWAVDAEGSIGSPVTYGTSLATYLAYRTLQKADPDAYREAIGRAVGWFRRTQVRTVLDAAATLLALEGDDDAAALQRKRCFDILRKGQSEDGGWGPYVSSASEPFDTAVVLLALKSLPGPESVAMLRRGRAYLLASQQEDGSWPETTRPPGRESYAQRLSTTGWAALALLATRDK